MKGVTRENFVENFPIEKGSYIVQIPFEKRESTVLSLEQRFDDEEGLRFAGPHELVMRDLGCRRRVASAVVRAGGRHPGILPEDLSRLHRLAKENGFVELFVDINALTTGLATHVVESLGVGVARIVVASTTVDVLHESQAKISTHDSNDFAQRAEIRRGLSVLGTLWKRLPVHVHQLPPGASRYLRRGGPSGPRAVSPGAESWAVDDATYVSEDRQMIAAYWDYLSTSSPRIPVHFITSDFALAHVCAAERVPFLFAKSPHECWRREEEPRIRMLWMDHCTLGYRAGLVHDVLWELSLVYGKVLLKPTSSNRQGIRLEYERRDHMPGDTEVVDVIAARSLGLQQRSAANRPPKKPKRERSPKKRARLELSLLRVLEMLPKTVDDVVPLSRFRPKGKTAVRQFGEVGRSTQLYGVDGESVVAGRKLPELLEALERRDIARVNKLFRAVSTYDEMLRLAAKDPRLPNQRTGGAATGWAVCLGAAFKQKSGASTGYRASRRESSHGWSWRRTL